MPALNNSWAHQIETHAKGHTHGPAVSFASYMLHSGILCAWHAVQKSYIALHAMVESYVGWKDSFFFFVPFFDLYDPIIVVMHDFLCHFLTYVIQSLCLMRDFLHPVWCIKNFLCCIYES